MDSFYQEVKCIGCRRMCLLGLWDHWKVIQYCIIEHKHCCDHFEVIYSYHLFFRAALAAAYLSLSFLLIRLLLTPPNMRSCSNPFCECIAPGTPMVAAADSISRDASPGANPVLQQLLLLNKVKVRFRLGTYERYGRTRLPRPAHPYLVPPDLYIPTLAFCPIGMP